MVGILNLLMTFDYEFIIYPKIQNINLYFETGFSVADILKNGQKIFPLECSIHVRDLWCIGMT
jgi:hypothetical protein